MKELKIYTKDCYDMRISLEPLSETRTLSRDLVQRTQAEPELQRIPSGGQLGIDVSMSLNLITNNHMLLSQEPTYRTH